MKIVRGNRRHTRTVAKSDDWTRHGPSVTDESDKRERWRNDLHFHLNGPFRHSTLTCWVRWGEKIYFALKKALSEKSASTGANLISIRRLDSMSQLNSIGRFFVTCGANFISVSSCQMMQRIVTDMYFLIQYQYCALEPSCRIFHNWNLNTHEILQVTLFHVWR